MTLQQLKYAVEVENCGSFSKASETVFISQPSLSNAIKELEAETGVKIFKRNNRGVTVTAAGADFLQKARTLLRQFSDLGNSVSAQNSSRFSLAAPFYSPVMEAFIRFIKQYPEASAMDYRLLNGQSFEIIDMVYRQEADLGVILRIYRDSGNMDSFIKDRGLRFTPLTLLPFMIRLRKNHPFLGLKRRDLSVLADYPLVHYRERIQGSTREFFESEEFSFINEKKSILVFDRDLKNRIVAETDAYSIGLKLHPNFAKYYKQEEIPLPGKYAELGFISRAEGTATAESEVFINILKEEVRDLQAP